MFEAASRWSPGESLLLAWPGGQAIIDSSLDLDLAERIWTRLRNDPQLGTFLKTLAEGSGAGFLDLPDFAVSMWGSGVVQIAVRGDIPVQVQTPEETITLTGQNVTTWAERTLPQATGIRIGDVDEDGPTGPLGDGVIRGSGLVIGVLSEGGSEPVPEAPAPPAFAPPVDAREEPADEPGEPPRQEKPPTLAPPPLPEPPEDLSVSLDEGDEAELEGQSAPPQEHDEAQEPAPPTHEIAAETLAEFDDAAEAEEEPPTPANQPQSPNPYASLWDESVAIDVAAAAVRPEEMEEAEAYGSVPEVQPDDEAGPQEAIDPREQLEGETVVDEGSVDIAMPVVSDRPMVLARQCDRGHANPPEKSICFSCGAAVSGEAQQMPRPQLGWLRIEGGETIPLNGPVILGRNPKSTAVQLDESARLVALPHPHVSGTHLVIFAEGWRLMARDLNSSNGSFLRRHKEPPVRLPESDIPLISGDLIDLGKGVFIHLDRTP